MILNKCIKYTNPTQSVLMFVAVQWTTVSVCGYVCGRVCGCVCGRMCGCVCLSVCVMRADFHHRVSLAKDSVYMSVYVCVYVYMYVTRRVRVKGLYSDVFIFVLTTRVTSLRGNIITCL